MKDKKYEEICKKLGFEPRKVPIPDVDTEDDSWINPFSVLTEEESDYLVDHGYIKF